MRLPRRRPGGPGKPRSLAAGAALVAGLALASAPDRAEARLHALLAAPDRVTIDARPPLVRWGATVTLSGAIASNAEDEVTIESNMCGRPTVPLFREAASAHAEDGRWSIQFGPLSRTVFRARWRDATSEAVTVRVRPNVLLSRAGRRFSVGVRAIVPFWRKRVVLQRYDRRGGRWVNIRSIVLTDQAGTGISVFTSAKFRAAVSKNTLLRAVLPLSQARPCYMAGYSNLLRT